MTKNERTPKQVALRDAGKCGARRKAHGPRLRGGVEIAPAEDPDGGPYYCTLRAGHGTDHRGYGECKYHGGNTTAVKTSSQAERAQEAVRTFGLPREIAPAQALLEEVHRTAGIVGYLDQVVGELTQDQLKQYDTGKDDTEWEKPSVWVQMYQAERAHFVKVCAEAIKCGVAERAVRLAEQQGMLLAQAIRGILTELGVADHPEAPQVVRRHLTLVATEAA